ncbi:methyl-accepting chemotaxis protein [Salinarchaeum sp. Harcht-Bsk1]|nr:methyl-accepting chemotaxis protein [Salinarchaeum sp. Harcht-Bsk1]
MLFGVVVLLIGGVGGLIYVQTADALEADAETRMEKTASLQASTLANWVDSTENHASLLSQEESVAAGDTEAMESVLANYAERAPPGVTAVHYVDQTGQVQASSAADAVGRTYDTEWSSSPPADGTTMSNPYEDPGVHHSAVAAVAGTGDDGAVVLVANLTAVSGTLERPSDAHHSHTHVVNEQGTVVLSHHGHSIGEQNMGPADELSVDSMAVRQGLAGQTGYTQMTMDGEAMGMGFTRVEGTDWVLMAHVPTHEAFALQEEISKSLVLLLVVALGGLGAIGVLVGRNTTKSIRELAAGAETIEQGDLEQKLESDRTDEIGQLYDSFDGMRVSLRDSLAETEEARKAAEHRREEVAAMADELEATADELATVAESAAHGDLTEEMDADVDNESMERIASEFNEMTDEIQETVAEIRQFSDRVAAHGEQVTASAEEVEGASKQVSVSVQAIADKTERQHETYDAVKARMEDMTATTEEIASQSDQVAELAQQTATTGEAGQTAAREASGAMSKIDADAERAVEEFDQLRDQLERVEEIAESIGELASQTNMLALNANIEASRTAGSEDDKAGFGAVAQEVKEMASDTRESATEIEDLVEAIREQTEATAAEIESTRSEVASHAETIEEATDALDGVAQYAEQTYDGMDEITTASQTQATSAEEVLAMVEDAAELSESVHEEAGRVAAAAEEQTSALSTVTEEASSLTHETRQLRQHLEAFQIEAEVEPEGVPAAGE